MLKIDGVHIEKDLGLHLLQGSSEPILPSTRTKTLTIPDRHGALSFGSYLEPKQFLAQIMIPGQSSLHDVQAITREVSRLLLDDYGNPKEVKLEYDYEPDKYYIAKFEGSISIARIAKAGMFSVPLTAYDPQAKLIVENHEISWDSTELTYDSSVSMDHYSPGVNIPVTAPTTIDYYVNGYAVRPTIIIEGSADSLTVSANGQSFSLGAFTNDKYEVIGQNYTVKKNDTQNGMPDYTGDFLELLPEDNTVSISGSNIDITFSLIMRDQY